MRNGFTVNPGRLIKSKKSQEIIREKQKVVMELAREVGAEVTFTYDIPITDTTPPDMRVALQKLDIENALFSIGHKPSGIKLYGIVHGWDYKSIQHMAKILDEYDFDGLAVGGVTPSPANIAQRTEFVSALASVTDKPLHCLGITGISDFYVLAILQVSTCDSKAYSDHARFRKYILPQTGQRIPLGLRAEKRHKLKILPCTCPFCLEAKRSSKENNYESESDFYAQSGSVHGAKLALHNLSVYQNEISLVNACMEDPALFRKVLSRILYSRPQLRIAFKELRHLCNQKLGLERNLHKHYALVKEILSSL